MRAVVIPEYGAPEVLRSMDWPDPVLTSKGVRIRVKAAGLNFAEVTARKGLYPDAPKPPCIVGYEGSGVVEAIGSEVTHVQVGDRVMYMSRFGGHAELVVVDEPLAVKIPEAMTFEQAASLPVNYLTAWHMLFNVARVREGDHLLVHACAGGVGNAALQLLKTVPGVTIYGTASKSKHEHLRKAGCHHPIDYRNEDYVEEVRKLVGERGLNFVFDPLGGKDWKKGYSLLTEGGLLVAFGMSAVSSGETRNLWHLIKAVLGIPLFTPMGMMGKNHGVSGVNMGTMWHRTDLIAPSLGGIVKLFEEGIVAPVIDSTFSFAQAADAHRRLESGKNIGKVLLIP